LSTGLSREVRIFAAAWIKHAAWNVGRRRGLVFMRIDTFFCEDMSQKRFSHFCFPLNSTVELLTSKLLSQLLLT